MSGLSPESASLEINEAVTPVSIRFRCVHRNTLVGSKIIRVTVYSEIHG